MNKRSLQSLRNFFKNLRRLSLLLTILFTLPQMAWGGTVTKTITFNKTTAAVTSNINESSLSVSVTEQVGSGTPISYDGTVKIWDSYSQLSQYSCSENGGAVFTLGSGAVVDKYFTIEIPGTYPTVPSQVTLKVAYANSGTGENKIQVGYYGDGTQSATAPQEGDPNVTVVDFYKYYHPYRSSETSLAETTLTYTGNNKSGLGTNRDEEGSQCIYVYLAANATFTIKEATITYETDVYGLSVAGIPVTGVNKDDVLGNGKISYTYNETNNSGTLTLNNATIEGNIVSTDDLIIKVSGTTSMKSIAYSGAGSGTLTIEKDESSNTENKLTLSSNDGVITDFTTVTITEPMHVTTPATEPATWTNDITYAVITDYQIQKSLTDDDITVTINNGEDIIYDGREQTPTVTVTDGTYTLSENDYEITTWSNNTNAATASDTNAPSVTITGKGNYTGTRTVSFTISPKPITEEMVTLGDGSFTYNGSTQMPTVRVGEDPVLTLDTDYSLSNGGGVTRGTYGVQVTGMGNYTGSVTKEYIIYPLSLSSDSVTVEAIANQTYTGAEIIPELTVMFGTDVLGLGNEYTVSGTNNTNVNGVDAAVPTLTLTAVNNSTNNFVGTKTVTFNITQADLSNVTIEDIQPVTYNGFDQSPETISVTFNNNYVSDDEYTVSYQLNDENVDGVIAAGTYTVILASQNKNFSTTNTKTATFTINKANLSNVTIEDIEPVTYDTESHVPELVVRFNERMVDGEEYTVSYKMGTTAVEAEDIVSAGTYTVTLTAIGINFIEGTTKEATFVINDVSLDLTDVFPAGQSFATYYSTTEDYLIPDGVKAYIITNVSSSGVTATPVSYIKAGVPVLLEQMAGATNTKNPAESFTGNKLIYAEGNKTTTGHEYVLYNGEFIKATGTIPAGKRYLEVSISGARPRLSILHEGEGTTGIWELQSQEDADGWYNLNGSKLSKQPTRKGIYINNGKKIIIK